jgi:tRNA(fMet)-specific endonuclease VapC
MRWMSDVAATAALRYLLDTNIVSDLIRNPQGTVARRIAHVGEAAVCTSIVVACELRYGVARQGSHRLIERVDTVLSVMTVLPLTPGVDRHYADIRAALEQRGTPIGGNDLLIAAQARAASLRIVTRNLNEFSRIAKLKIVDWLK